MKIRFVTTVNQPGRETFHAGEVHDLPNAEAYTYVSAGNANKIAEPATVRDGEVMPGPVRQPDGASQAVADLIGGVDPAKVRGHAIAQESTINLQADRTVAIPGADTNPAYVAPDPLPSAKNVGVAKPAEPKPAETPKSAAVVPGTAVTSNINVPANANPAVVDQAKQIVTDNVQSQPKPTAQGKGK